MGGERESDTFLSNYSCRLAKRGLLVRLLIKRASYHRDVFHLQASGVVSASIRQNERKEKKGNEHNCGKMDKTAEAESGEREMTVFVLGFDTRI